MNTAATMITGSRQRLAGNRRLILVCLLIFLLSSCLSFWVFFPAEILQRRLVQELSRQAGLQLESRNASLLFPLGLELDLTIYPLIEELNQIDLQELQVSPVWTSLFGSAQAIAVKGSLAGGSFEGQAGRDGHIELTLQNVGVDQLQSEALPYRLNGRLQAGFNGENLSPAMRGKGDFRIRLTTAEIVGLEKFGLGENFNLGTLEVEGKLSQRRLSLEKIGMIDGLIELSGGGTLLIGTTPQKTRLNLNVRLLPTQSTPAALRELLSLTGIKPTADGSYLLRIGGTLANPVIR